jgi:hypothetical protein
MPQIIQKMYAKYEMIVSAIWNIGQLFYSAIVSTITENYKICFTI